MQGWDTRPADTPSHPRPLVNSGRSRAAGVRLAGSSLVPVTVWRSRRRGDTHGHVSALPQLNLGVFGLPAKTTSGAPGLGVVAARSRLTLAGSQESGAGGGSSTAPRVWVGAPETWRLRYWGGGGAPLRPPGSAARAAPPPHSLRVLFSAKKSRSCTLKALPSPPISARRAPGAPQSCCKSPGLQLQAWGAESAPSQPRACTPPTDAHPAPHPHRCPRGSRPIRGRARGASGGQTPRLFGLRLCGPGPAAAARPRHTHRPGRAVRARLRSEPASPGSAASGPRSGSGSRSAGLGSAMVAAAASAAGRACVCARARGVCVCVCAGGSGLPCAPRSYLLFATPRCRQNPYRAPHRPALTFAHTHAHSGAHSPAAVHRLGTPGSPSWGAHKGPPAGRAGTLGARPCALTGPAGLRCPAAPGGDSAGGPAPSPNPGPGAYSGFQYSRPKRGPLPLRCRPSYPFQPVLSGASPPSPTCPARSSVSPLLSVCLAAALSRAPSSPPPCAASHILRITAGAARRSRGPGFERAVGGEGTRRARPRRPLRSSPLRGC
uniref:translation initiation factor IF-2-like n=1 Tax=Callithrix jacchus TaxID=9483 RepID=UPI0023DD6583|nr:translation initiation factor IF-2-like [Callithrix jacchus]